MRGGFLWIPVRRAVGKVYTRRVLVDPGPDPLDAWNVFLFLFTRGWILVNAEVRKEDPVQWITGIRACRVREC